MSLQWGNQVIQMITKQTKAPSVAIIRHSERPAFDNLPHDQWDLTELTEKGIDAATQFGEVLGSLSESKTLQTFGWGLKRCQLTAEAISKGAETAGCHVVGPASISLKSPITNRSEYEKTLHSPGWDEFVMNWLNENDPDQKIMVPIGRYTREILRQILKIGVTSSGMTTVIATHDLHILPLISHSFSKPQRFLDYLDGILIARNGEKFEVKYNDQLKGYSFSEITNDNSE